jgi:hypothetical protein
MITDAQTDPRQRWQQLRQALQDEIQSIDNATDEHDRRQNWWRSMLALLQKVQASDE